MPASIKIIPIKFFLEIRSFNTRNAKSTVKAGDVPDIGEAIDAGANANARKIHNVPTERKSAPNKAFLYSEIEEVTFFKSESFSLFNVININEIGICTIAVANKNVDAPALLIK